MRYVLDFIQNVCLPLSFFFLLSFFFAFVHITNIPNMKYYTPRLQSCFVCVSRVNTVITRSIFDFCLAQLFVRDANYYYYTVNSSLPRSHAASNEYKRISWPDCAAWHGMAHHVCISHNEWIHNTLFHRTLYTAVTAATAMIHCRLYSSFRRNTSGKRSELCAFVFDFKFTSKRLLRLFWLVQSNNDVFAYIYTYVYVYVYICNAHVYVSV